VLQAFAQRLRGRLRSADTAARLGVDDFAVLVHGAIDAIDAIDADGVDRVVGRSRAELPRPIDLGAGRHAVVGASIGAAIADAGTDEVETLLRSADAVMYTAKRAHEGGYVLHEEPREGRPELAR
jgi:diguanylate cyclase (GGDEF)-like protein